MSAVAVKKTEQLHPPLYLNQFGSHITTIVIRRSAQEARKLFPPSWPRAARGGSSAHAGLGDVQAARRCGSEHEVRRLSPLQRARAGGTGHKRRTEPPKLQLQVSRGRRGTRGGRRGRARALIDSGAPFTACARHFLHRKKGPTAFQTPNVPHAPAAHRAITGSKQV